MRIKYPLRIIYNTFLNQFFIKKFLFFVRNFDETDSSFTLELIMEMEMQKYADQISEISNKATMELNIENVRQTTDFLLKTK